MSFTVRVSLSMAFDGLILVIETMHHTVGTPMCVQFRAIDEVVCDGKIIKVLSINI